MEFSKFCARGDYSDSEAINGPCWRKWQIEYDYPNINEETGEDNPLNDYGWIDTGEAFDNLRLWKLLKTYDHHGALIAASVSNNGENKRNDGIVEGHAYTVKAVYSFKKYKLLNLRNPWGQFEWTGKWSDNDSKTWQRHKKIAKKINFVAADDGAFWISFKDFLNIFNVIEICDRTTISNLHLDTSFENEDEKSKYKLSIIKGCLKGCM